MLISIESFPRVLNGRNRVMHGTVIVYYESEIKFASHDTTEPERVAKWILADLVRRVEFRKKRTSVAE